MQPRCIHLGSRHCKNFLSCNVLLYFERSKVSYGQQEVFLLEFLVSFAPFGYEASPTVQSCEWSARSCAPLYSAEPRLTCGVHLSEKNWSSDPDFGHDVCSKFLKAFGAPRCVYAAFWYQLKRRKSLFSHRSFHRAQLVVGWLVPPRIPRLTSHQMLLWKGCIRVHRTADSCLKTDGRRLHC